MTPEQFAKQLEDDLLEKEIEWRIELAEALRLGKITGTTYKEIKKELWQKHLELAQSVVDELNNQMGGEGLKLEYTRR
jgi:U3 small nucleolar RNA-associated protein 14